MKIFRISNILCFAVATTFCVLLFWTSQAVQKKEDELAAIQKTLAQEEDTIRVLSVEWDYLNRPQRLEKLAIEQLGMTAPNVKEVVRAANEIPEPVDPFGGEDGLAQIVSMDMAKPVVTNAPALQPVSKKPETVQPSTAEKQSFDKLIQSLDDGTEGSAE